MGQRPGQLCAFRDRQRRYRRVGYGPNLARCFRPDSLHGYGARIIRIFTSFNLTSDPAGTKSVDEVPPHQFPFS